MKENKSLIIIIILLIVISLIPILYNQFIKEKPSIEKKSTDVIHIKETKPTEKNENSNSLKPEEKSISEAITQISEDQSKEMTDSLPEKESVKNEKSPSSTDQFSLKGTTYIDDNENKIIKNTASTLVLVNKNRTLPSDYIPEDLIVPNIKFSFKEDLPKKKLRKSAATALETLFDDAKKDGIYLLAVSGYRSYNRQKYLFNAYADKYGEEKANKFSARPGQSEHQTGLAMDITSQSVGFRLTTDFGKVTEGKWVQENAYRYGFIIRYPKGKEDLTKYQYEPWHLRYVGKEAAQLIHDKNIIFEKLFVQ